LKITKLESGPGCDLYALVIKGDCLVQEFIYRLEDKDKKNILALFNHIIQKGPPFNETKFRYLGDEIMKTEKWFKKMLKSFEKDFDFRLETIILDLTNKISKRMKERNINRVQLADLLNVSPPAVTKILNGTSNFTLKSLLSIADALDLNLEIDFKEKESAASKLVYASSRSINEKRSEKRRVTS